MPPLGAEAAEVESLSTRAASSGSFSSTATSLVMSTLDFWASWCKQCVVEMIREEKMKTLLKDKPLEFLYVSLDEDTAMAGAVFRRYKIDGKLCFLKGGWNAPEVTDYGVQALPAYFLVDEEGKFGLQNAPSPVQSTQLILEMEKLFHN
jgi:thiol-disulfide isomerase/thioredoxin